MKVLQIGGLAHGLWGNGHKPGTRDELRESSSVRKRGDKVDFVPDDQRGGLQTTKVFLCNTGPISRNGLKQCGGDGLRLSRKEAPQRGEIIWCYLREELCRLANLKCLSSLLR